MREEKTKRRWKRGKNPDPEIKVSKEKNNNKNFYTNQVDSERYTLREKKNDKLHFLSSDPSIKSRQ